MKNKLTAEIRTITITGLSHDGRGIASSTDGKKIFIANALPGEVVAFKLTKKHARFNEGETVEVISPAAERITPECEHFGNCGGCSMQHLAIDAQVVVKQKILLDQLQHFGLVEPTEVMSPLSGNPFGYRRKARLGVRYVNKKNRVLVGFREKASNLLSDIASCAVLHPRVGKHLTALATLVQSLSIREHIPQIEVAVGDENAALVFRHLQDLSLADQAKLSAFGMEHQLHIYTQPNAPAPTLQIWPELNQKKLNYLLPAYALEMQFNPWDFTQVNGEINPLLIERALALLDIQSTDNVLDLFCGLGNFTLPMARFASAVTGIEGSHEMVTRAQENALHNNIHNTQFYAANLADIPPTRPTWMRRQYDKILLDPGRNGAKEIIKIFSVFAARKIVYVSCNPATLARDAGELVRTLGYKLKKVGVINMFPQTSHIEAIALFEK
ncbi:MAG: 23S rRNA (uracil(1939)-C(5))-methyltransferase RlmD [Pseudomonadota bacterium]